MAAATSFQALFQSFLRPVTRDGVSDPVYGNSISEIGLVSYKKGMISNRKSGINYL